MNKTFIIIFILFLYSKGFSQQVSEASISISGTTLKRINKLDKDFNVRKKFNTENLGNVKGAIILNNKSSHLIESDKEGSYKIDFKVSPNKNYFIEFSKKGYYSKRFEFNTNGISNHKKIDFDKWDFYLFKRVIGLSDSIFNIPTKFYYDSERGYMTYDEKHNLPLDVIQSENYVKFINNLNHNNIELEDSRDNSKSYTVDKSNPIIIEVDTLDLKDENLPDNELPEIHIIDVKKLMIDLEQSQFEEEIYIHQKDEISHEWQQLEIAKTKAVTSEDKSKILAAEQLLLEKEKQITNAKIEIEKAKRQIEIHSLESRNKNILLAMASFVLVLVAALFLVVFKNSKQRIKNNLLLQQKNKEVIDSIKYAQRLQNAILPPINTVNQNLIENFILYKPKDIVSGDFYWVKNIEDFTLFAVVDCTGHGVPGAFMSIIAYNAINQAVNQHKLTTPSDILTQVNKEISKTLHQTENPDVEDGMDISLCKLNTKTNELEFAGAHHSLNIVRNKELEVIKGNKYSIGSQKAQNKIFENHLITLNQNDYIYIFSDGYADQFGGEKERKFMYKRLRNLLCENSNLSTEKQKEILISELNNWKGNLEQVDDICVMGVKIV